MQCEECHERPATVHFTKIINGNKSEQHLCEACARRHGNLVGEAGFGFPQILKGFFEPEPAGVPPGGTTRCEVCGWRLADFRRTGHLGCSHCYEQFARQLTPIIRRIQGGTEHRGKVPRRLGHEAGRRLRLRRLREELELAVRDEAYERAAQLRDEIRGLEQELAREEGQGRGG